MPRFDITQWCDFVRGVADPDLERSILDHLERHPGGPGSALSLLGHVDATARNDTELEVPEAAVRRVQSMFDLRRPESVPVRFLPFEIVFDSLHQPAPVGTRNLQSSSRQLMVETRDFVVDVRLEQTSYPKGRAVVGQIFRRGDKDSPLTEVPVLVTSQGGKVSRTETGTFGEFQTVGLEEDPLDLYLFVKRPDSIRISFADLRSPEEGDSPAPWSAPETRGLAPGC